MRRPIVIFCVVAVLASCTTLAEAHVFRPVVMLHGTAANTTVLDELVTLIRAKLPGIFVYNMEIGDGIMDSIIMPLNEQVAYICSKLQKIPELQNGFNLIGFSQGGLVNRGFLQRCNRPRVHNFITWLTPHQGVYGVPFFNFKCEQIFGNTSSICQLLNKGLDKIAYTAAAQQLISVAGFWKDPFALETYERLCQFLPDIENRNQRNTTYRDNVLSVNNFVAVHSPLDQVVVPNQSSEFGFYAANSTTTLVPLRESEQYLGDWIGLRTLDKQNRLHIFQAMVQHTDHHTAESLQAFADIVLPFLSD